MGNNGIKNANWIFLCTVLISCFAGYIILILFSGAEGILNIWGFDGQVAMDAYEAFGDNTWAQIIVSQVVLIAPTIIYLISNKGTVKLRFNKIKGINIVLIIVFSYLCIPLVSFINLISMLFVKNEIANTISDVTSSVPLIVSILLVCVLPCFCEEFVYRGVIYNEHSRANPRMAIIFSGLLFGVIHMNFNQFAYAFVMGIIFALLVEATNSILSSMLMHCVINTNSIIIQYISSNINTDEYIEATQENASIFESLGDNVASVLLIVIVLGVIALISTVLAGLLLVGIANIEGQYEHLKSIIVLGRTSTTLNDANIDKSIEDINVDASDVNTININTMNMNTTYMKRSIVTVPLIVAFVIGLLYMILIEFYF